MGKLRVKVKGTHLIGGSQKHYKQTFGNELILISKYERKIMSSNILEHIDKVSTKTKRLIVLHQGNEIYCSQEMLATIEKRFNRELSFNWEVKGLVIRDTEALLHVALDNKYIALINSHYVYMVLENISGKPTSLDEFGKVLRLESSSIKG